MRSAIIVPDLGAGQPTVSAWHLRPGEWAYAGDRVVELLFASATFDVAAPCTGRLVEKCAFPNDAVATGSVLGYIEEAAEEGPPS